SRRRAAARPAAPAASRYASSGLYARQGGDRRRPDLRRGSNARATALRSRVVPRLAASRRLPAEASTYQAFIVQPVGKAAGNAPFDRRPVESERNPVDGKKRRAYTAVKPASVGCVGNHRDDPLDGAVNRDAVARREQHIEIVRE